MSQNTAQDVRIQIDTATPSHTVRPSITNSGGNNTTGGNANGGSVGTTGTGTTGTVTAGTGTVGTGSINASQPRGADETNQDLKKSSHGWTPDARKLVKLWAGQIAINRQKHQQCADSMGGKSTNMKIVAAIFGSLATLVSFLNTSFGNEPTVGIVLNVFAGVFAAISTLVSVILAILALDSESEKHRQTAIQYANVCNEAQTVLVEEHEENLPQATEFLRKMKDLTHLIQLFGPSLEERADSDLPSIILLRGVRGNSGTTPQNVQSPEYMTDELAGIFDHDDKQNNSPGARKKKRADMLNALRSDTEDVKRRQQELIADENELKALSKMLSVQAGLTAEPSPPANSKPISVSAPNILNAATEPIKSVENPPGVSVSQPASVWAAAQPVLTHSVLTTHTNAEPSSKRDGRSELKTGRTSRSIIRRPFMPGAQKRQGVHAKHDSMDSKSGRSDMLSLRLSDDQLRSYESPRMQQEYEPQRPAFTPAPVTTQVQSRAQPYEDSADDSQEYGDEEFDMTDSDEPHQRRDHISPVVRSSLRESMFPQHSTVASDISIAVPTGLRENIASSDGFAHADGFAPADGFTLTELLSSGSNSNTNSGEGNPEFDEYARTSMPHTRLALGGVKKMQIAPEVLREEIRRRENKIQAQKAELEDKKRNNQKLKRKIEKERRINITQSAQRVITVPQVRGMSSSRNAESSPQQSPALRTPPTTSRSTEGVRGMFDKLKDAFSPQKTLSRDPEEVVQDVHVAQREKMLAIQDLCGDELSFECMREEN